MTTDVPYRWEGESTDLPILFSGTLPSSVTRWEPSESGKVQIRFQGSFTSSTTIRLETSDWDLDLITTQASSIPRVGLSEFAELFSSFLRAKALPETRPISDFADEPYEVIKAIPVRFRQRDPGIEARFEEANIAWVDDSWIEAYNGLKAEILNTFEDYEEDESILGPEPKRQLAVLRRCILRNPSS